MLWTAVFLLGAMYYLYLGYEVKWYLCAHEKVKGDRSSIPLYSMIKFFVLDVSLNLSQFVEDQNGLHTSQILLS